MVSTMMTDHSSVEVDAVVKNTDNLRSGETGPQNSWGQNKMIELNDWLKVKILLLQLLFKIDWLRKRFIFIWDVILEFVT